MTVCFTFYYFNNISRNSNVSTVEEELFKALLEAKIILQSEFNHPKTMKFQRAARTDKGVSAVRNIVSLKLPVLEITRELPEKINKYLPPEVRVVGKCKIYLYLFNSMCSCSNSVSLILFVGFGLIITYVYYPKPFIT